MAIIRLKGLGQKEIDRVQAKQIKEKWVRWKQQPPRERKDAVIDLEEVSFSLSDINIIDLSVSNYKTDYHEEQFSEGEQIFTNERKRIIALSPQERAKRLGFVKVYWKIMTCGGEIPEQEKPRIIEMQRKFFTENPQRQFIDPWLLNDVVSPYCGQKAIATMSMIEEIIRTDKHYARFN